MESVIRAFLVYTFVMLVLRFTGRRSLGSLSTFDFVMLIIISETTQSALTDMDNSLTNSFLLILAFTVINIGLSLIKRRFPRFEKIMDGEPLLLVENGRPIGHRLAKARVDVDDIMQAARNSQGLERLDQIKYAVLESSGHISIIPCAKQ